MKTQSNQSQTQLLDLLTEIVKQNSAVIQQSNQLIQQTNQVIQINSEQNAQINELLIQLEGDEDEPKQSRYLDD